MTFIGPSAIPCAWAALQPDDLTGAASGAIQWQQSVNNVTFTDDQR
jgi:hypothetical protein